VPAPCGAHNYSHPSGFSAERCASSRAIALHRSPLAFLVDSDETAAVVEQIVGKWGTLPARTVFLDALAGQL
jgi:hypothetical protein